MPPLAAHRLFCSTSTTPCLCLLCFRREVEYKGLAFSEPLTLDLYVDDCLLVELKAVQTVLPIHKAQLLSYMKLLDAPIGLLINFHELSLKDGIHRLMLPGSCGAGA
jgi:hypothetical protein